MGRDSILNAVRKHKPELVVLPEVDTNLFEETIDSIEVFTNNVKLVGGQLIHMDTTGDLDTEIKKLYPKAKRVISQLPESNLGTDSISEMLPNSLKNIDLAVIKGGFGVAENGAIWISEEAVSLRILPFITNDLVIVLSKKDLCLHMHEAYERIRDRKRTFGVFISGPSKTADIEQCLVIGAQGAMSLTVVLQ